MYSYINSLTRHLFEQYGNRKHKGLFCLLFDCNKKAFLPVPVTMEHVELVMKILMLSKSELQSGKIDLSFLVPVTFSIDPSDYSIHGLLTGISGLEMGYKVRHTKEQLSLAHKTALLMLHESVDQHQFTYSNSFHAKLSTNFQQ